MALHLIKLCVGCDSVQDLEGWIKQRLKDKRKRREKPEHIHRTRMVPKRSTELTDGGSLYWVIKGYIAVHQKLIDIRPARAKDGIPRCALVYEPELIPTTRRAHRPFQGWRYLKPQDAPPDARTLKGGKGLPEALRLELAELGLL